MVQKVLQNYHLFQNSICENPVHMSEYLQMGLVWLENVWEHETIDRHTRREGGRETRGGEDEAKPHEFTEC